MGSEFNVNVAHSITEYLDALKARHPVYAPYRAPVYSNAAYALLGYTLERLTGRTYTDIIQKDIFVSLGMENSSIDAPRPDEMLILVGDSQWDLDDGFIRP
jgi:CubicO group peptidase (beta-lactamase class C family)